MKWVFMYSIYMYCIPFICLDICHQEKVPEVSKVKVMQSELYSISNYL